MEDNRTNNNHGQNNHGFLTDKKWQILIVKIAILLSLLLFSYLGFKYYIDSKVNSLQPKSGTVSNTIEDEIFDLSDEYKSNGSNTNYSLDENNQELTPDESKKDSGKALYRILIKNQIAIKDLTEQVSNLKQDIEKHKNQEQLTRVIYTYSDLRQKIFFGQNYDNELKNFELLTINNNFLETKSNTLKDSLKNFKPSKDLAADFKSLIPQIIASKNNNSSASFIQKIKFNLLKLIVIRRTTNPEIDDLDGNILQIQDAINNESYLDAINLVAKISNPDDHLLDKFLLNLNAASDVAQTDSEILYYLKETIAEK